MFNAIAALPEGRSMPINPIYLDGVNVWLLSLISQQTGLNITYSVRPEILPEKVGRGKFLLTRTFLFLQIGRLPASFNSRTDDVNATLYGLYNFEVS